MVGGSNAQGVRGGTYPAHGVVGTGRGGNTVCVGDGKHVTQGIVFHGAGVAQLVRHAAHPAQAVVGVTDTTFLPVPVVQVSTDHTVHGIILIVLGMAQRICFLNAVAVGIIPVGGTVAVGVRFLHQAAVAVILIAPGVPQSVTLHGHIPHAVVLIGSGMPRRISMGSRLPLGVVGVQFVGTVGIGYLVRISVGVIRIRHGSAILVCFGDSLI